MLTGGSVFSGIGLLDYGLHLAGIEHAWFCEADEWRRGILRKRWPGLPVYDDVRSVGAGCPGVHLVAGGFPCKGASTVGKLEGFGHPETVLWFEMARAIRELRPRYVLVENVANILGLHGGEVWGTVLGGLAAERYDVVWDCLPAASVGAPHLRDRVFAIATDRDSVAGATCGPLQGRPGPVDRSGPVQRAQRLHGAPEAPADASRDAEGRTGPQTGADRERARASLDLVADSDGPRADAHAASGGSRETVRERGIRVDWGQYRGAIERWEEVHGTAPKPLVRGMDARGAARVVRSRLSALGDGVQVQVGYIAGTYIRGLEEGRLAA